MRHLGSPLRTLAFALVSALAATAPLSAAAPDDNVEWDGLSHHGWQDRRPLVPLTNETFEVRFQAFRNDLTAARVNADDGTGAVWVTAAATDTRGPYDIWTALVPGSPDSVRYWIEVTDGTDTDYLSVDGATDGIPTDGGWFLDFSTFVHAPLGATLTNGTAATFRVWAPNATTCHVRGTFNGWGLGNPLPKIGDHFVGRVTNVLPGHEYQFFFDGADWRPDARGRAMNPTDNNNSIVVNPFGYAWQSDDFQTPPFEQLVIYQLHVGTFAGLNDPFGAAPFPSRYVDVANRASHLSELGVNAVMVNPITEFPGDLSAGYNPITQWAPEWKYGSPDDLRTMIDSLHSHGIAVLLDVVWNHFSTTDNFLWFYDGSQIYFDTPAVQTPWGDQADFDHPEVRDYFVHSMHYWLEEFRFDGFRADGTDFMNMDEHASSGWSLMQRWNDEVDRRWADKIVIAEQLPDDGAVTTSTDLGGAGYDTQYFDAFTDRLREEILDAAFGDPEMFKIRDVINGFGPSLSGLRVTNYVELHDEAWPTSGGQRLVKTIDISAPYDDAFAKGRTKLAQGVVMLSPGIPAMLMGTEWLEDTDFGTDLANRIDWSHKTTYAQIFDYYRDLIALRRGNGAFFANAGHGVHHLNEGGNVIGWHRFDGSGSHFVVLANFSNTDYTDYRVGLPVGGDWSEALNSQDAAYMGSGLVNPGTLPAEPTSWDGFGQSVTVDLPAMGLVVLENVGSAVSAPGPGTNAPGRLFLAPVSPNPASGRAGISYRLPQSGPVELTLHDARGRQVRRLVDEERPAGVHAVTWDGRDTGGRQVQSGLYFLRLEGAGSVATRKFLYLR